MCTEQKDYILSCKYIFNIYTHMSCKCKSQNMHDMECKCKNFYV
jgi:hypothetical protein